MQQSTATSAVARPHFDSFSAQKQLADLVGQYPRNYGGLITNSSNITSIAPQATYFTANAVQTS